MKTYETAKELSDDVDAHEGVLTVRVEQLCNIGVAEMRGVGLGLQTSADLKLRRIYRLGSLFEALVLACGTVGAKEDKFLIDVATGRSQQVFDKIKDIVNGR